jgi:hypothetical protein
MWQIDELLNSVEALLHGLEATGADVHLRLTSSPEKPARSILDRCGWKSQTSGSYREPISL